MKAYSEWGYDKVIIDKIEPTHFVRNFLVMSLVKKYSGKVGIRSVCEIGCGTGSLSCRLGSLGLGVYALDLDKNAIRLARKFNKNINVRYSSKDVLRIERSEKYDLVVCIEVLEHIKEDRKALAKINRLLKPGGLLLMTVPIHEKYRREFDNRSGHIRRYNPAELLKKIKEAGFEISYSRHFNFPFLWLWYFLIYLPYSNKKEKEISHSRSAKKTLPKWIYALNVINKFFLIDLLFNSKKYSTDMVVVAQKYKNI